MKKTIFFIIVVASVFIIKNLIGSIYTLWNKQELLSQTERTLEKEQQKNKRLKDQLSYVKSSEFLEEEARNKLFLVKPGEREVVISSKLLHASSSAQIIPVEPKANWKKWIDLFF